MKYPLTHEDWQRLRLCVRAANEPTPRHLTGKDLRIVPNRRTKDGTFLDDLVARGLLEVVERPKAEKPKYPGSKPKPIQFATTYKLTAAGEVSAEFGEYEKEIGTPVPVRDTSAPKPKPKSKKK